MSVAVSFSGHETFPFRYTWLKKAVDHVTRDPEIFGREDAMVSLGVGKNMVQSIRHWALVCGVIEEDSDVKNNRGRRLRVTELGSKLFGSDGWDPFLEDPATPWLLHWQICTAESRATTWYWVFNRLSQIEFSKSELERNLMEHARDQGNERVTEASLSRDIDCFLRTYVSTRASRTVPLEDTLDCPLVDLGLIRENQHRSLYLLGRGDHPDLPIEIFAFALVDYLRRARRETKTIPLDQLVFGMGSPGRVFALTEDGVAMRMDGLERVTDGALAFDETAGMRQVLIGSIPETYAIAGTYYRKARPSKRVAGER